mgnify:CR=1 FL=1
MKRKNINILVVDDNPMSRDILSDMLYSFNCRFKSVESGQLAIDELKGEDVFDVVLMDLKMPGMDGLEATKITLATFSG